MGFFDEVTRDVVETETDVPTLFRWKHRDYPCTADKFSQEVLIDSHGNPRRVDLSLRVRVQLFANPDGTHSFPQSGDLVTFFGTVENGQGVGPGEPFKVRRLRSKQYSICWVDCIDVNV